jgi:hypothetical protein
MIPTALTGRTALVIGAGAAVADALSRAGASVVHRDPAEPVVLRRLVDQLLGAFGRLDLAVNHFDGDGVFLAMRYEVAAMRRTGGGWIVNVAPNAEIVERTRELAGSGVRIRAVAVGPGERAEDVAEAVLRVCSVPVSAEGAGRRR